MKTYSSGFTGVNAHQPKIRNVPVDEEVRFIACCNKEKNTPMGNYGHFSKRGFELTGFGLTLADLGEGVGKQGFALDWIL